MLNSNYQTLHVDGTTYTLKLDRELIEFAKLARTKFRKRVFKQNDRAFPTFFIGQTTADYLDRYQSLNVKRHALSLWKFTHADGEAATYDPTMPLMEALEDA